MAIFPKLCDFAILLGHILFAAISKSELHFSGGDTKENQAVVSILSTLESKGLDKSLKKVFTQDQVRLIIQLIIKTLISILNAQIGKDWINAFDRPEEIPKDKPDETQSNIPG